MQRRSEVVAVSDFAGRQRGASGIAGQVDVFPFQPELHGYSKPIAVSPICRVALNYWNLALLICGLDRSVYVWQTDAFAEKQRQIHDGIIR
jgi:hypothetical protein